jgi:TetR/AcrR family tetracycline transcriptional repressor
MALYRYVANKEALLEGLGDLVLGQIELPQAQKADWRRELRAAARSFRAHLIAHPAALPIFLTRPLFTPAATRTAEAMLGLLRGAGFPPEQAVLLYQQLVRFLLALVMLETGSGPGLSDDERREKERVARITLETLPPDEYPHLVEAAPHLAGRYDPERAFEAGLDLLVAGIERLRPRKGSRPSSAR